MRRLIGFAAAPTEVVAGAETSRDAAAAPVEAAAGPSGTLPRTGAALASLAAMALLAVVAGRLLPLATRRQARMVA